MITYVKGDATKPQGNGLKIIAHVCNDSGGWGAGFVLALNKMSLLPRKRYREKYSQTVGAGYYFMSLGHTQRVKISDDLYVFNMIAQHSTVSKRNPQPLSYEALEYALGELAELAQDMNATVHMPRIGCGLAGGDWSVVESIINRTLRDVDVTVYDL
jgi:O-acetyl-ADP-ribose deacetylase (regulator of RNase III)